MKPPAVIELRADLGGGKTTFTRGLAIGLGSKDRVASPTFTISKQYSAKTAQIHHYDFYRLSEPGIVSDQLQESLQNQKVVTVVEWGESVKDVLPENRVEIVFKPTANNSDERDIKITYPESILGTIKQLETSWSDSKP